MNCKKCGVVLSISNCRESILNSGGPCRKCLAAAMASWASLNRERVRAGNRRSYKNNIESRRADRRLYSCTIGGRHNRLKVVLRADGVSKTDPLWSLNYYSELVRDQVCHYCFGALSQTGHGLDRTDNTKPHISHNVVPCCSFCNDRKSSVFLYDEMMLLAPALRMIRERREAADVDSSLSDL